MSISYTVILTGGKNPGRFFPPVRMTGFRELKESWEILHFSFGDASANGQNDKIPLIGAIKKLEFMVVLVIITS